MTDAMELVVQDPFEVIRQAFISFSFTPESTVLPNSPSSSFAGAVITTRFAPARKCACASSYESNTPVASTTTSIPSLPHGNFAGSFSCSTCSGNLPSNLPYTVSYLSKYSRFSRSPKSLMATTWRFRFPETCRKNNRPILPNPLIAIFVICLMSDFKQLPYHVRDFFDDISGNERIFEFFGRQLPCSSIDISRGCRGFQRSYAAREQSAKNARKRIPCSAYGHIRRAGLV